MNSTWLRIGDLCVTVRSSHPDATPPQNYGLLVEITGFGGLPEAVRHDYTFITAQGERGSAIAACLRRIDDDDPNRVARWDQSVWRPGKVPA